MILVIMSGVMTLILRMMNTNLSKDLNFGTDLIQFFSISASSQFLTQVYPWNILENAKHLSDPKKLDVYWHQKCYRWWS